MCNCEQISMLEVSDKSGSAAPSAGKTSKMETAMMTIKAALGSASPVLRLLSMLMPSGAGMLLEYHGEKEHTSTTRRPEAVSSDFAAFNYRIDHSVSGGPSTLVDIDSTMSEVHEVLKMAGSALHAKNGALDHLSCELKEARASLEARQKEFASTLLVKSEQTYHLIKEKENRLKVVMKNHRDVEQEFVSATRRFEEKSAECAEVTMKLHCTALELASAFVRLHQRDEELTLASALQQADDELIVATRAWLEEAHTESEMLDHELQATRQRAFKREDELARMEVALQEANTKLHKQEERLKEALSGADMERQLRTLAEDGAAALQQALGKTQRELQQERKARQSDADEMLKLSSAEWQALEALDEERARRRASEHALRELHLWVQESMTHTSRLQRTVALQQQQVDNLVKEKENCWSMVQQQVAAPDSKSLQPACLPDHAKTPDSRSTCQPPSPHSSRDMMRWRMSVEKENATPPRPVNLKQRAASEHQEEQQLLQPVPSSTLSLKPNSIDSPDKFQELADSYWNEAFFTTGLSPGMKSPLALRTPKGVCQGQLIRSSPALIKSYMSPNNEGSAPNRKTVSPLSARSINTLERTRVSASVKRDMRVDFETTE